MYLLRTILCLVLVIGTSSASQENFATEQSDPLQEITRAFPQSIEYKPKLRVLEFCPDNTCDGFEAASDVSKAELRDFAYLYIYFFSDYYVLQKWREKAEPKETAQRLLSKAEYRDCKAENSAEATKCVLRNLSAKGRIKLVFIRYDEDQRNVVRKDLAQKIAISR